MPATMSGKTVGNGEASEPPQPRLAHLPARSKLERLLQVARGHRKALVVTHDNPDPDSLAAATALAQVLQERAGLEVKVGYGGIIGRSENMAFVKVLRLQVTPLATLELDEFDLFALVDTQPSVGNHSIPPKYRARADVVIDHHPLRDESLKAPFADVGGDFGATSTMLVEYLRAARLDPAQAIRI